MNKKKVGKGNAIGFVFRLLFSQLALLLMLGLCFVLNSTGLTEIEPRYLVWIWLTFAISNAGALITSEFPRGDDHALLRLALSSVGRTGLPLLVFVLLDFVAEGGFLEAALPTIICFYFVGFLFSIGATLRRLSQPTVEATKQVQSESAGPSISK